MDRQHSAPAQLAGSEPDRSKVTTRQAAPHGHLRAPATATAKPARGAAAPPGGRLRTGTLTDSQVLKALESRRAAVGLIPAKSPDVAVLPPEDTNTRLVLREAVALNAPVYFAVQLQWSVQPIDVKSVPADLIFQAYRLYAAEGRRGGRTWFFLRVGFFNDAVSAKQVAHYLRRNFASAAVVPVGPQEREQVMQRGRSEAATVARSPRARSGAAS
jgi:hypothetical protein